jgi:hypothetical protein
MHRWVGLLGDVTPIPGDRVRPTSVLISQLATSIVLR